MLKLKVRVVREGQHPSESVIEVLTADGKIEELIVDASSIKDMTLNVGYAVGSEKDRLLIELPRETMRGLWRVWVPQGSVIPA